MTTADTWWIFDNTKFGAATRDGLALIERLRASASDAAI